MNAGKRDLFTESIRLVKYSTQKWIFLQITNMVWKQQHKEP